MRFLVASVLIAATVIALATLVGSFKQTARNLSPTPTITSAPSPALVSSPTTHRLILTPIASPTLGEEPSLWVEKWDKLGRQDLVYFAPQTALSGGAVSLIVYSHGAGEVIDQAHQDSPAIQKLRKYAPELTKASFILAASSLHGDNWGSSKSVDDIADLAAFFREKYEITEKIDLWGFSMGALPVMLYTVQNPDQVGKIALFAPSVNLDYWSAEKVGALSKIPVKIWHGDKDQNVPYQQSQDFLQKLLLGGVPVEFETVAGAGHFDLEDVRGLAEFFGK